MCTQRTPLISSVTTTQLNGSRDKARTFCCVWWQVKKKISGCKKFDERRTDFSARKCSIFLFSSLFVNRAFSFKIFAVHASKWRKKRQLYPPAQISQATRWSKCFVYIILCVRVCGKFSSFRAVSIFYTRSKRSITLSCCCCCFHQIFDKLKLALWISPIKHTVRGYYWI